jgi:hypothetical protein
VRFPQRPMMRQARFAQHVALLRCFVRYKAFGRLPAILHSRQKRRPAHFLLLTRPRKFVRANPELPEAPE